MLNNLLILFFSITLCCCSLRNKTQLKSDNFVIAKNFKDSVLNTKPKFLSFSVEKSTFRYVYSGQVHTLKSNFFVSHDSIVTINLYTPFNISVLNFKANKHEIEIIDKRNSILSKNTYNDLFKFIQIPLQFNDFVNIIVGQGFFPHNATNEQILNRIVSVSKNLITDKYSISMNGSVFNVISKYILPYNKLISREIFNTSGESLLKTHYIITENSFDNFPKETTLEFNINENSIEFDFQLPPLPL
jgi:hypothetical protein